MSFTIMSRVLDVQTLIPAGADLTHPDRAVKCVMLTDRPGATVMVVYDGNQAIARISPNSRSILRQALPPSSLQYTSPNRLKARMMSASAGWVAKPQMVEFGAVGRVTMSHVEPKSVVRKMCPLSPVVLSPQPANRTPGSSVFTAMPRA